MDNATINENLPKATHGSPSNPLKIGGLHIPCYVLEDGTRVLSGRGMQEALALGQRHGALLKEFLSKDNLQPFINNDLSMVLFNPIRFIRPGRGGKVAVGYEATILADVCDAVLTARDENVLTPKQLVIAKQCEILTRAFAKVGIIALVDEATGYQEERDKDELQKFLALYLSEERLHWAKMFPDEYYRQLFRLRGWAYSPLSVRRPKLVGKLTNDLVYKKLPEPVLEELRNLNPVKNKKTWRREGAHHQHLSADLGQPDLRDHLLQLIAIMRISPNWPAFQRNFAKAFPAPGDQLELDLDCDEID